ncbi:MAG: hypothetical protein ACXWEY_03080 [Bacteroidia bacterium]
MVFFSLAALFFMLFCIGAGIAVAIILALIFMAFAALGIVTASAWVGLQKRSFEKGFRVFWLLCTGCGALVSGAFAAYIINRIFRLYEWWIATGTGALIGLVSGLVVGAVSLFVLSQLTNFLKNRFTAKVS